MKRPPFSIPACHVALAEAVAAIGDGDLAVGSNLGGDLLALAIGGLLDIGDHVGACVVRLVVVEKREMPLPDAFDPGQLGEPQIGILLIGRGWLARDDDRLYARVGLPKA